MDPDGKWTSTRAVLLAAAGQNRWPPAGTYMAATGQDLMAADTGGCGTRFGKRHPDHNFSGIGGIEGGWFCESSDSCRDKPTGDHYCGMCTMERRTAGAVQASQL